MVSLVAVAEHFRTRLVAVDPGVNGCGCAWFDGMRLYAVEYRTAPLRVGTADRCVCEKPQIYAGTVRIKGHAVRIDPDDLIRLAIAAGRMTSALETTYVRPAEWKGQVPKGIHQGRILNALTPAERELLDTIKCRASLKHNVIDAIGIGLKEVHRI